MAAVGNEPTISAIPNQDAIQLLYYASCWRFCTNMYLLGIFRKGRKLHLQSWMFSSGTVDSIETDKFLNHKQTIFDCEPDQPRCLVTIICSNVFLQLNEEKGWKL